MRRGRGRGRGRRGGRGGRGGRRREDRGTRADDDSKNDELKWDDPRQIFVGQLPREMDEEALKRFFLLHMERLSWFEF